MSQTRLKKPAYSKDFQSYQLADDFGLCHLYCGSDSWSAKKTISPSGCILPPNENPADYNWTFMANQTVIANVLGYTDLEYRERTAFYILRAGAKQVLFILPKEQQEFQIGALIATQMVSAHERYTQ
jgi:hypothetical protein